MMITAVDPTGGLAQFISNYGLSAICAILIVMLIMLYKDSRKERKENNELIERMRDQQAESIKQLIETSTAVVETHRRVADILERVERKMDNF